MSLAWELDFSQACSFCRMLINQKNFNFTQIPDKTNDAIFLKSPKTMFWGYFWPFFSLGIFSKNSSCHTKLYMAPNFKLGFRKKLMSQSQENLWAGGRMDRQILFYRTLPFKAQDPTTFLQQVAGGKTPNLVLKRKLRYLLKIPPLKKILQF